MNNGELADIVIFFCYFVKNQYLLLLRIWKQNLTVIILALNFVNLADKNKALWISPLADVYSIPFRLKGENLPGFQQ